MVKREKQRNRFMLACFLCVLVPLLLGMITYSGTCNILMKNARELNRTVLENARDLSDMRYEEVDTLCSQIYITVSNSQMLHAAGVSDFQMQIKKMDLIKSTNKLMQGVNFVSTYYLYLEPLDLIITEDSAYASPELFYTDNLQADRDGLSAWRQSLVEPRRFLTARAETFAQKQSYRDSITFYRTFPFVPYNKPQGCIALTVSQKEMLHPFKPLVESGSVYRVMDEAGNVLFSSGEFPVSPDAVQLGESQIRDKRGDKYSIVSLASSVSGWRFDAATNTTKLFATMSLYRQLYFGLSLGILLVGIAISIYMSLRAMKPVNQLIDRSDKMEEALTRQSAYLSTNLWEKLLAGDLADEKKIEQIMEMSGLKLPRSAHVAIDIRLDQQVNEKTVHALAMHLGEGYAHHPKPNEIMLCMPLTGTAAESIQLLEKVRKAMNLLNLSGIIGMSKARDSLTQFYQSYFEAETALTYAKSTRLPYARYEDVGGITEYLRPLADIGEQLLQAVMSGQMSEVSRYLTRIQDEVFNGSAYSYFTKLQVIYELRHIVLRCTRVLPDEHELDKELLATLSKQNIRENPQMELDNLCSTLAAICALREQELNREKPRMKSNDMVHFISEHYHDPQLSLRIMAEEFHMNETYISTYFKQTTGVSFADYLQQLRMEKATMMIRQGEMKVAQIAEAIGYTNDQTFRRAFKRVIGVSPSAYRNACFGLQSDKEDEE